MDESPSTGPLTTAVGDGPDPRAERVAASVRLWSRHLVDLGGRNTLLWYRDLRSGTLDLTTAHPGGVSMLMAGRGTRLSDLVRERSAFLEARRRAERIRAKALELSEERGITTGFMAIGMATWEVPGSARAPQAPVLLRRCSLVPTGAAHHDFDIDLGADVEVNPVLLHYLRIERGLTVDADALAELTHVNRMFDPMPAFREVSRICAGLPGFRIADRKIIGTFSYAKLPMVADLAALGDSLADHDVIAALAGDKDALRSVRTQPPRTAVDLDPDREMLVLDADASQQSAIEAARSGSHLVIQGPPGTGKSQTIANLIATLTADGKRVLFVAEKRAAIDAVVGRLDRVGLSELVLDAHGGIPNRRRVARDLAAAIDRADPHHRRDDTELRTALVDHRHRLVDHRDSIHGERHPWGVSVFEAETAVAQLSAMPKPPTTRVRLRGEILRKLDRRTILRLRGSLAEAVELGAWTPGRKGAVADPWYGARITTPEDAATALRIASDLVGHRLDQVREVLDEAIQSAGLSPATTPADWGDGLELLARLRSTLATFRPEVLTTDLDPYLAATGDASYREAYGAKQSWRARHALKKAAKALLREGRDPQDLHTALRDAQAAANAWKDASPAGAQPRLPEKHDALDAARATWDELHGDLTWLGERLATTGEGGDLITIPLPALRSRLTTLTARADRLAILPKVVPIMDELDAAGLGPLVADLAARRVPSTRVHDEVDYAWWGSILDEIAVTDARYGAHNGVALRWDLDEYVRLDHAHLRAGASRVRAAVARRIAEAVADHPEQESVIRAEAGKARRHRPIRDLLPAAYDVLTAAKPCWVMSPLVVASLLPPGRWFDVVVFDEASQIPPAQAVSAIARGRQIIVAGDDRQLPPTTFFTTVDDTPDGTLGEDADQAFSEGFESILDLLAAALPARRLSWHYRSRDERLIAFANRHWYGDELVTFPGTATEQPVQLVVARAPAYDVPEPDFDLDLDPDPASAGASGISRTADSSSDEVGSPAEDGDPDASSPAAVAPVPPVSLDATATAEDEAAVVVQLALDHAANRPDESLGIVALGIRQAQLIREELQRALDQETRPDVVDFFDDALDERSFIKNLERVQGDERDAIILSVGFGRRPDGTLPHRFGPLNVEGGDRRLNVAVTRARQRMTIVSTFTADDLDPERLTSPGARRLRDYLWYAEHGGSPAGLTRADDTSPPVEDAQRVAARAPRRPDDAEPIPSMALGGTAGGEPNALIKELAVRLRREKLVVHESYGVSAHRVDLAVEDPYLPGKVVVAVESDGAAYAGIRSTRERERLRTEQLRRLGWRPVRVWSTDIFRDPARDVARIVEAARGGTAGGGDDAHHGAGPADVAKDRFPGAAPHGLGGHLL